MEWTNEQTNKKKTETIVNELDYGSECLTHLSPIYLFSV